VDETVVAFDQTSRKIFRKRDHGRLAVFAAGAAWWVELQLVAERAGART